MNLIISSRQDPEKKLPGRKSLIIRKSLEFLDEACKQALGWSRRAFSKLRWHFSGRHSRHGRGCTTSATRSRWRSWSTISRCKAGGNRVKGTAPRPLNGLQDSPYPEPATGRPAPVGGGLSLLSLLARG